MGKDVWVVAKEGKRKIRMMSSTFASFFSFQQPAARQRRQRICKCGMLSSGVGGKQVQGTGKEPCLAATTKPQVKYLA